MRWSAVRESSPLCVTDTHRVKGLPLCASQIHIKSKGFLFKVAGDRRGISPAPPLLALHKCCLLFLYTRFVDVARWGGGGGGGRCESRGHRPVLTSRPWVLIGCRQPTAGTEFRKSHSLKVPKYGGSMFRIRMFVTPTQN